MDTLKWPTNGDIQIVPRKYIFYRLIELNGFSPLEIKIFFIES